MVFFCHFRHRLAVGGSEFPSRHITFAGSYLYLGQSDFTNYLLFLLSFNVVGDSVDSIINRK